jgi:hypothetical protein
MSWNTADVHRLANFEVAKAWYEKTKPIRGNKENIRPYGSRRHHYMASIAMPDENTVQLKYYGHTLVEWRSDNTYSVFSPRYYSAYAPDHIAYYLPLEGQHFAWDRGRIFYCVDTSGKEKYHLPREGRLDFQMVGGKSFLLNAPVAYNIRSNRGVVPKLMTKYGEFLSWMQVVLTVSPSFLMEELEPSYEGYATALGFISNDEYKAMSSNFATLTPEERDDYWEERYARDAIPFGTGRYNRQIGFHRQACLRMQEMIEGGDPDDWVRVLHIVAYRAGHYHWVTTQHHRKLEAEQAVDYIKQLITYLHRDEVFRLERLPKGEKPSLTNGKFYHDLTFVPRKLRQAVDSSI